jgi:hypothetical protein
LAVLSGRRAIKHRYIPEHDIGLGVSYGLEFPFCYVRDYRRATPTFHVYSRLDGWILDTVTAQRELGKHPMDVRGRRWHPDLWQQTFWAARAAARRCREANGLWNHFEGAVLAAMDAQELCLKTYSD